MLLNARSLFSLVSLACVASGCGSSDGDDFTYVALGASDAVGIGADTPAKGYASRIQDGLENDGYDVRFLNLGILGAEIGDIENVEVAVAKEADADVITLFTGGNDIVDGDSPEEFEATLGKALAQLREEGSPLIFIATLPDLTQLPRFIDEPSANITEQRVNAFNDAIRRQAAQYGATTVDLFAQGVQEVLVSGDGFHPSNAGHERIAEEFLLAIRAQVPKNE